MEVTPRYKLLTMQCMNEFTCASHCISKNVTPLRMLKKCSLIAKNNRWNNRFQNIYDTLQAKVDRLAERIYFVHNPPENHGHLRLSLEGAGGQTDDTSRVPLIAVSCYPG